jgi:hypothetical protein
MKAGKLISQKNDFSDLFGDLKKAYEDYRYLLLNLRFSHPISHQTVAEERRRQEKLYKKIAELIFTVNSN